MKLGILCSKLSILHFLLSMLYSCKLILPNATAIRRQVHHFIALSHSIGIDLSIEQINTLHPLLLQASEHTGPDHKQQHVPHHINPNIRIILRGKGLRYYGIRIRIRITICPIVEVRIRKVTSWIWCHTLTIIATTFIGTVMSVWVTVYIPGHCFEYWERVCYFVKRGISLLFQ